MAISLTTCPIFLNICNCRSSILTHVPIIGRFVEGLGAQYAERFLPRHAYLIPQRIASRAHLLKFFPKARLRGFGQIS